MKALPLSQQNQVTFAWALPEQLTEVWQLHEQCSSTWSHPRAFFEESLAYQRVLLAHHGNIPIAYLIYQVLWGNTAFLSLVKVLPENQRQGIGTALVKRLEERLLSLGFKSYVTSSERINQQTKRLLPTLGFNEIGELSMHHGGEIFYLKTLS